MVSPTYRPIKERLADHGSTYFRLDAITPEQAYKLWQLAPENNWVFEPEEFRTRLEADPDCEFSIFIFGPLDEIPQEQIDSAHATLDILGVAL